MIVGKSGISLLAEYRKCTVISDVKQRTIVVSVVPTARRAKRQSNESIERVVRFATEKTLVRRNRFVAQIVGKARLEGDSIGQRKVEIQSDDSLVIVRPATENFTVSTTSSFVTQEETVPVVGGNEGIGKKLIIKYAFGYIVFGVGSEAETKRRAALPYISNFCLLYTSPSPRDATLSRMPSSA